MRPEIRRWYAPIDRRQENELLMHLEKSDLLTLQTFSITSSEKKICFDERHVWYFF